MSQEGESTTGRTCIVTRASRPSGELIRFVLDPDGRVMADLRHRLPGRGVWVTASAIRIAEAEKKRLFARAFKAPAMVEPGLADRVGEQLRAATRGALSLARKAGALTTGYSKVEGAIASGKVVGLIHATDAGADGVEKLNAALRRRFAEAPPPIIRSLSAAEIGLALGGAHVIHAALLAGRASRFVLDQISALARYFDQEPDDAPFSQASTTSADLTAGHDDV